MTNVVVASLLLGSYEIQLVSHLSKKTFVLLWIKPITRGTKFSILKVANAQERSSPPFTGYRNHANLRAVLLLLAPAVQWVHGPSSEIRTGP